MRTSAVIAAVVVALLPGASAGILNGECWDPTIVRIGAEGDWVAYFVVMGDLGDWFWYGTFLESNGIPDLQQGGNHLITGERAECQNSATPDQYI